MIKKIENNTSSYYKYFVEADDEEPISVKVAPRKNRGTDYADDTTKIKVSPDETSNDLTDYSAEDDTVEEEPVPQEDVTDDTATEEEPPADEELTGPDTGDDGTDYNADTGDDTESDTEGNEDNTTSETNTDEVEKRKKYNMYKRYLNLYEMINNFLEKLRSVVTSNPVDNSVIKVVMNNLNDLYDNMYDYMTIRFKDDSYVQVLMFFETSVSVIKLNLELLRNNHINLKQ